MTTSVNLAPNSERYNPAKGLTSFSTSRKGEEEDMQVTKNLQWQVCKNVKMAQAS